MVVSYNHATKQMLFNKLIVRLDLTYHG